MGVDIGGIYYQTTPFNGWYSITEIARDFLDKQRYDLAEAVAAACNIPRTKLRIWRDDVQLQMHRAILHSFTKNSVSIVDHHTASESFLDFYKDEISKRKKCPADWVWLVPPAGSGMTGVFHQEMVNFILKPQYRPNVDMIEDQKISTLNPIVLDEEYGVEKPTMQVDTDAIVYDKILICFGSETGTSHRFATNLATDLVELVTEPLPLDELPILLQSSNGQERILVLIITSSYGRGEAPNNAKMFLERMEKCMIQSCVNIYFSVFALGNSAYTQSFVAFGKTVNKTLNNIGALQVLGMKTGDELMDQNQSYVEWKKDILDQESGILYKIQNVSECNQYIQEAKKGSDRVKLNFRGFAQVIAADTTNELHNIIREREDLTWSSYNSILGRSTDLFSFQLSSEDSNKLNDFQPGDHIALYPENLDELVDFTHKMLDPRVNGVTDSKIKDILKSDIDLSKPVSVFIFCRGNV